MINSVLNNNLHRKNAKSQISPSKNSSFKGGKDLSSTFVSSFHKLNISEQKFIKNCQKTTLIGRGTEGQIYNIPFSDFSNYVMKIFSNFESQDIEPIAKIKNDFPYHNFGQPIAKIGEDVLILRRLPSGNSLDKFAKNKDYFEKISKLPQEKFNNFFKYVKMLNQKNYKLDGGNSGNVYLDTKLNLLPIDISQDLRKNMIGDVLLPFFQANLGSPHTKAKETVIEKLFNAEKKHTFISGMRDDALTYFLRKENPETCESLERHLDAPEIKEKINKEVRALLGFKTRS